MNDTKPSKPQVVKSDIVMNSLRNRTCRKCYIDQTKSSDCPNCPRAKLMTVPDVDNYSQCKRAALEFLGVNSRVWKGKTGEPTIIIGFEGNPGRIMLGYGDSYQQALEDAVLAYDPTHELPVPCRSLKVS